MLPMDMKYVMLQLCLCSVFICSAATVRGLPESAGVTPHPRIGRLSTQQKDPLEFNSASLRATDADSRSDPTSGGPDGPHELSGRARETTDTYTVAEPYVISNAAVGGPAAPELQAELDAELRGQQHGGAAAGAFRGLLHGRLQPRQYPFCSRCRIVQCRRRRCTGHCRTGTRLRNCNSSNIAMAACAAAEPPTIEDVRSRDPDAIAEYDTVVVTAEAPYIGCADIANRPSSCPAPGTRATLGGMPATVLSSRCVSEVYLATTCDPLHPFGICDCFYRTRSSSGAGASRRSRFRRAPCRTTELAAGSGVGGADGTPSDEDITVLPAGNVTQTWFSNFTDPGQEPQYRFSLTASVRGADVDVSLAIFPGLFAYTDGLDEYFEDSDEHYDNDYGYDYGSASPGGRNVFGSPVDGYAS